jgi:hypothetical protein
VIEQSDLIGYALHHRPDLPAFGQEIVVGIDQKERRAAKLVLMLRLGSLLKDRRRR